MLLLVMIYPSSSLHDPLSGPHLSSVAVWMAEALVGAEEVEAVHELGDNPQPRHVLLEMLLLLGQQKQRLLREVFFVGRRRRGGRRPGRNVALRPVQVVQLGVVADRDGRDFSPRRVRVPPVQS